MELNTNRKYVNFSQNTNQVLLTQKMARNPFLHPLPLPWSVCHRVDYTLYPVLKCVISQMISLPLFPHNYGLLLNNMPSIWIANVLRPQMDVVALAL